MAQVTLELGVPTATSFNNWVQWDERSVGLGDISIFSDTPGEPRHLIRLRVFFSNGRVQFQTIDIPDGTSGFASGEDLSDAWETNNQAITLLSTGVRDLILPGPNASGSQNTDEIEPYQWDTQNSNSQWFNEYQNASFPACTLILDDGAAFDVDVDAGDVDFAFAIPQPDVQLRVIYAEDAGGVAFAFSLPSPSVSIVRANRVNAGNVAFAFTVPAPTVNLTTPQVVTVIASAIESGVPSMSARVRTTPPGTKRIAADIQSGIPAVLARVRTSLPGVKRIVADIQSGIPSVLARVRVTTADASRIRTAISSGVPTIAARVRVMPPLLSRVISAITSGIPAMVAQVRILTTSTPDAPGQLGSEDVGQAYVLLSWDEPNDNGEAITGYEYRIGTGQWVATGTSATMTRVEGLSTGTSYSFTVRAINSVGASPSSLPFLVVTLSAEASSAPRFMTAHVTGNTSIDLSWEVPLDDGGTPVLYYQICVIEEDGTAPPFEPTDGTETMWRIRGLALGHRYGFRIRAINAAGRGIQSDIVYEVPARIPTQIIRSGQPFPLLDVDRQDLVVRLAGIDCLISVWWQPSDASWYGSLEVPVNTPAVSSRRLMLNAGLLDRITDVLPGNIVCRELGEEGLEPNRDAWARPTHGIMWEANG